MKLILILIIIALSLFLYFLPVYVAKSRNHKAFNQIFLINFFAGWSVVGWLGALVWAYSDNIDKEKGDYALPPIMIAIVATLGYVFLYIMISSLMTVVGAK